jgi:hypothetical protein
MNMRVEEMFPGLEFSDQGISWTGGEYVRYSCGEFVLDGNFTIAELKALVEWAEEHERIWTAKAQA